MKLTSTLALIAGLAIPALAPNAAKAHNCFILVHGNKPADLFANRGEALKYWRGDGSTGADFTNALVTASTSTVKNHYGIVGWNSSTANYIPFWHDQAAGEVARQITNIQAGKGDAISHANQCVATDKFYVVAHSQGAQVMTYINGNAKPTDPNYNVAHKAYDATRDARDLTKLADGTYKLYSSKVAAPFSTIMSKVVALITVGGAINGTEGMDDVCNGGLDAQLLALVGKTCVPSLQTYSRYNPSSFTGTAMYRPTYSLGGTGNVEPISTGFLTGEDDGVVNLASQMNCVGNPARDLENDLREWNGPLRVVFTCNGSGKRHTNGFNLASMYINHTDEVTAKTGYIEHKMIASGVLNCGDGKNVPNTITACLGLTK